MSKAGNLISSSTSANVLNMTVFSISSIILVFIPIACSYKQLDEHEDSNSIKVYPPGFRLLLNWLTDNYGTKIPIIVTENGVCDKGELNDYDRVSYFNNYLNQLLLAIHEDGNNIAGYFAWTLMDDFEWTDGYSVKFGLYHVDYKSPERTRIPKLSAINYHQIVKSRRINFNYIKVPKHKVNDLYTLD